jgi:carnosine N-methyltransferase
LPCANYRQGEAPPRVLVPGAGLGRLCVEAAAAGFETQGNEFSYFMLLTAAFMLNSTVCAEQWTVHPWLHMTCNNQSDADQLRGVAVPDVVPGSVVPPGLLSMCAGDFAVRGEGAVSCAMLCAGPGCQAVL